MIASVTELNLKNFWSFIRFIPHAVRCKIQAGKTPGLISISFARDGILSQRTLTVWEDERSLIKYIGKGSHLKALQVFKKIAKDSYTVRYECKEIPSWEEAKNKLNENGVKY